MPVNESRWDGNALIGLKKFGEQLRFPNENFDIVVAANVIHLLDEPYKALHELDRVCRKGGRIPCAVAVLKKNRKSKTV